MTPPPTPVDWPAPGADGISVRLLDVGAKTTLRGRRLRRALHADTRELAAWPASWRDLLREWLDGAPKTKRRWDTLIRLAGNARFTTAHDVLGALLGAGLVETDEAREQGQWKTRQVTFIDPAALRNALGMPDTVALRAQLAQEIATTPDDVRLAPLWHKLAALPPARGLARCALLRKLDTWIAENRFGTRRDFALFARGGTKAVSSAEWLWLEALPDFTGFGIERHAPALWLRAPLTLCFGGKTIDLSAIPDMVGLSPATFDALNAIQGNIGCWRLVENRTSFERAARGHGGVDGVIWLPGFAPSWWKASVRRLLQYKPAPAEIACDPDPAGINIALDAGAVWQACGLAWSTWEMDARALRQLDVRSPLTNHDKVLLEQLSARELPVPLRELANWMQAHGEKGEQEGYL
jgi:hypothetical protein